MDIKDIVKQLLGDKFGDVEWSPEQLSFLERLVEYFTALEESTGQQSETSLAMFIDYASQMAGELLNTGKRYDPTPYYKLEVFNKVNTYFANKQTAQIKLQQQQQVEQEKLALQQQAEQEEAAATTKGLIESGRSLVAGQQAGSNAVFQLEESLRNLRENFDIASDTLKPQIGKTIATLSQALETVKQGIIGKQQGSLPLGGGGTGTEQVWQASWAIRDLNTQLQSAPEWLKPTIAGQIQRLREFSDYQKNIERIKASQIGDVSPQGLVTSGAYAGRNLIEALRSSEGEEAPELMLKYWATRGSGLSFRDWLDSDEGRAIESASGVNIVRGSTDFSREQDRLRELRKTAVTPPSFSGLGAGGSPTWRSWWEGKYQDVAQEFQGKPLEERQPQNWAEFLTSRRKEAKEEFMKFSPSQRGERPQAFAPRITTRSF